MSNEGQVKVNAGTSGQSGKSRSLTFDQLNDNEQAVASCLCVAAAPLKINKIVALLAWDNPCKVKGSSMVRNAMRRLVCAEIVRHGTSIGDGTYVFVGAEGLSISRNPRRLSKAEAFEVQGDDDIEGDADLAHSIKKSDCSFYNACLDQAVSDKWKGFSCTSCNAYAESDYFQRQMDHLALTAVQKAAELVEKYGKVHRVRGVKPGADARRTTRLKVVETVSLGEALATAD
jgi:hypothetical protein